MDRPKNETHFDRAVDQILEVGLRQMREENERLWSENRQLRESLETLRSITEKDTWKP
jgi:hypothetical protein